MNLNQVMITDASNVLAFVGFMAFVVSVITEVLKQWTWLDQRIPSALLVILLSIVLCPLTMAALLTWQQQAITAQILFACLIASFVVALVALDGWERVTELAGRLIKKE